MANQTIPAIQVKDSSVGIGTTTPIAKLHVEGAGIVINTEGSADSKYLYFRYSNGGDVRADSYLTFSTGGSPTEKMRITSGGNVLIGTTTDAGSKLRIVGGQLTLNLGTATAAVSAFQFGDDSRTLTYMPTVAGGQYNWASVNNGSALFNTLGSDWWVGNHDGSAIRFVQNSSIVFYHNSGPRGIWDSTGFGIGTTSPSRTLHVVGTTRHERVYAYANNVFQFANDISQNELWLHLGTQASFTTDKIYYRVNTNTSEEEGEIIVKNTCSTANIEWFRNSYNVMVTAVKARMQYGCGPCEIFIKVRYGSNYGGANTTVQWQVHNGTDSGFTTVNAVATPGTGTNEANIASTDGYMVSTSNNQSVGGLLGVGTTSPSNGMTTSGVTIGNLNGAYGFIELSANDGNNYGPWIDFSQATGADYKGRIRYWTATNSLKFYTNENSTELVTFTPNNVLIGTTTDAGYKLSVNGTAAFAINSGGIIVQSYDGNTGNIRPSVANGSVLISDDSGTTGRGTEFLNNGGFIASTTSSLISSFNSSAQDGLVYTRVTATQQTTSSGSSPAAIELVGLRGSSTHGRHAWIGAEGVDGTTYRTQLKFKVRAEDSPYEWSTLPTQMVIDGNGNVGIGTTSPQDKLEIKSGYLRMYDPSSSVGAGYLLQWSSDNGGSNVTYAGIDAITTSAGARTGDLRFFTSNAGGPTEKMRITGAGNVGIGTTAPASKLHVVGPINIERIGVANVYSTVDMEGNFRFNASGGYAHTFLNNGSELVRIMPSGNVGIGTTSPDTPLSTARGIVINSGASNDVQIRMQNNGTGSAGSDGGLLSISGSQMYLWNYEASNLIFGTNNSERMRIDSSGNVGIGTTSISYRVDISGDARILSGSLGVGVAPNATDGRIDASNDIVAYSTSDQRLKENVTPIENALEKVKTLTGVEFDWKEETAHVHGYHGHDVGIIAQDVQAVLPEAVRTNESGYLSVRYEKMIALLIEGMKEQQNQIDELKAKLDGLTR